MRTQPNSVFDGFMHRPYQENLDGWRMEQPEVKDFPAVAHAQDVLAMYDEICELRRDNWRLRQTEKAYHRMLRPYEVDPMLPKPIREEVV